MKKSKKSPLDKIPLLKVIGIIEENFVDSQYTTGDQPIFHEQHYPFFGGKKWRWSFYTGICSIGGECFDQYEQEEIKRHLQKKYSIPFDEKGRLDKKKICQQSI